MQRIRFFAQIGCTQIANSDKDLLWDVADNSINYCSNGLKKFTGVVQSTDKISL